MGIEIYCRTDLDKAYNEVSDLYTKVKNGCLEEENLPRDIARVDDAFGKVTEAYNRLRLGIEEKSMNAQEPSMVLLIRIWGSFYNNIYAICLFLLLMGPLTGVETSFIAIESKTPSLPWSFLLR